jgi:hypothetical protein
MSRTKSESGEVEAIASVYRQGLSPGSEACPGDEQLVALLLEEIAGEERDVLADHVTACERCSQAYRLLLDLDRSAGSRRATVIRAGSRWRVLALAAGLAAGAVGLAQLWPILVPPAPRPGERDGALRGPSLRREEHVSPPRNSILREAPMSLSWPAEPGAATYSVKLFDEAGEMIWQSEPVGAWTVTVPASTRNTLADGHDYFWVVEITSGPPRRLGPFPFRIDSAARADAAASGEDGTRSKR